MWLYSSEFKNISISWSWLVVTINNGCQIQTSCHSFTKNVQSIQEIGLLTESLFSCVFAFW